MNSIPADFLAKKKVALHMSFTVLDSLPLPRIYDASPVHKAIAQRALLLAAVGPEMHDFWLQNAPLLELDPRDQFDREDPAWRRKVRSEIDVLVGRDLYGLSKAQMEYILDPAEVLGAQCGFETFGALKRAEMREFRRYETRENILSTWDRLSVDRLTEPTLARSQIAGTKQEIVGPDELGVRARVEAGGWSTPDGNQQTLTLAQLGALVRVLPGTISSDLAVRAALFSLEPRLLTPHLSAERRDDWLLLVGPEALPMVGVATLGLGSALGWAEAKAVLIASGHLIENAKARTWTPGAELQDFPVDSWPGRAQFAFEEALRLASTNIGMSTEELEALKRIAAV